MEVTAAREEIMLEEEKVESGQRKAKEYQGARLRLLIVRFLLNILFISLLLFVGISKWYVSLISNLFSSQLFIVGTYFIGFACSYAVFLFPLSFYEGYALEHKFSLSRQTFSSWLLDHVKAFLLDLIVGVVLLEVLYFLLRIQPNYWWLEAAGVLILFSVILSNLTPVLILPLFYKCKPLGDQELKKRLIDITEKCGLKVQDVFEVELSTKTRTAEAALAGVGNTRRILISDTLLKNYNLYEVETIFAHELGHYKAKHIAKLILSQGLLVLLGLYLTHILLRPAVSYFGFKSIADVGAFPVLVSILGIFAIVSLPLTNGYSRHLEEEADKFALLTTKKPQAFIAAMRKLAHQNLSDICPHPAVEFFLYSHPSISKRIELTEQSLVK